MRLTINVISKKTYCIESKVPLDFEDDISFNDFLKEFEIEDYHCCNAYDLYNADLKKLNDRFNLNLSSDAHTFVLIAANPRMDNLPYVVHTGRELQMMLDGTEPMSFFTATSIEINDNIVPETYFQPYVDDGRIIKREFHSKDFYPFSPISRRIFYVLPGEEWRIQAYMLMWEIFYKTGWNASLERLEGRLLGYTDEECDIFMKDWKIPPPIDLEDEK